jgi:hypothetical protein
MPFSTADVNAPAANTAAVVTYTAVTDRRHTVANVAWSYDGTPTGGRLTIEDGSGNTVFQIDITTAGPGVVYFTPPKIGSLNTTMVVTLAAPGGSVSGKLSVSHWKE